MITLLRRGGRVTHVLLGLRGSSFDHHENHLRPQYNLSVFCHQQDFDMPDFECLHTTQTQTRHKTCILCPQSIFSNNGKDRNMEARVVQSLVQILSQSNHEHCSRSADPWWPSILLSIFCKNQNLSMSHKHCTAGRLINLQRMGGFYWYYYLLLEPQMTCFCSPRI